GARFETRASSAVRLELDPQAPQEPLRTYPECPEVRPDFEASPGHFLDGLNFDRSARRQGAQISGERARHRVARALFGARDQSAYLRRAVKRNDAEPTFGQRPGLVEDEDRKSTRLNSSHVKISYAVFCLKKKKKTWLHRYIAGC